MQRDVYPGAWSVQPANPHLCNSESESSELRKKWVGGKRGSTDSDCGGGSHDSTRVDIKWRIQRKSKVVLSSA